MLLCGCVPLWQMIKIAVIYKTNFHTLHFDYISCDGTFQVLSSRIESIVDVSRCLRLKKIIEELDYV